MTQKPQNLSQIILLQKENIQLQNLKSLPVLTITEKKVIKLFTNGNSVKQVAEILSIKPGTVNAHLRNIYEKMDIHCLTSMCLQAQKFGLNYYCIKYFWYYQNFSS